MVFHTLKECTATHTLARELVINFIEGEVIYQPSLDRDLKGNR